MAGVCIRQVSFLDIFTVLKMFIKNKQVLVCVIDRSRDLRELGSLSVIGMSIYRS